MWRNNFDDTNVVGYIYFWGWRSLPLWVDTSVDNIDIKLLKLCLRNLYNF